MKIFGIGLSRTGTKSLATALSILGYEAGHYIAGMHALVQTGNGLKLDYRMVDQWDALTDIPAAAFYKELDRQYPQSKFILTIRDMKDWLDSCERLFAGDRSEFARKKNIPLGKILQMRRQVYGKDFFDRKTFTLAYNSHVTQVRLHFQHRAEDLLIFDICAGQGWQPLCKFLSRPIPPISFPHVNASRKPRP